MITSLSILEARTMVVNPQRDPRTSAPEQDRRAQKKHQWSHSPGALA